MTDLGDVTVTALQADETLTTLALGGIINVPELGRMGLTPTQMPSAYDFMNMLRPLIIVFQREETPVFQTTGFSLTQSPILVYIYDDGNKDYGRVQAMYDRVLALLTDQWFDDGTNVDATTNNQMNIAFTDCKKYQREPQMNDACYFIAEFKATITRNIG